MAGLQPCARAHGSGRNRVRAGSRSECRETGRISSGTCAATRERRGALLLANRSPRALADALGRPHRSVTACQGHPWPGVAFRYAGQEGRPHGGNGCYPWHFSGGARRARRHLTATGQGATIADERSMGRGELVLGRALGRNWKYTRQIGRTANQPAKASFSGPRTVRRSWGRGSRSDPCALDGAPRGPEWITTIQATTRRLMERGGADEVTWRILGATTWTFSRRFGGGSDAAGAA